MFVLSCFVLYRATRFAFLSFLFTIYVLGFKYYVIYAFYALSKLPVVFLCSSWTWSKQYFCNVDASNDMVIFIESY